MIATALTRRKQASCRRTLLRSRCVYSYHLAKHLIHILIVCDYCLQGEQNVGRENLPLCIKVCVLIHDIYHLCILNVCHYCVQVKIILVTENLLHTIKVCLPIRVIDHLCILNVCHYRIGFVEITYVIHISCTINVLLRTQWFWNEANGFAEEYTRHNGRERPRRSPSRGGSTFRPSRYQQRKTKPGPLQCRSSQFRIINKTCQKQKCVKSTSKIKKNCILVQFLVKIIFVQKCNLLITFHQSKYFSNLDIQKFSRF